MSSKQLPRRILVTGGDGFLGRGIVAALVREGHEVVAADIREVPLPRRLPLVIYRRLDVRDAAAVSACVAAHRSEIVVHLASIVTPGRDSSRELEYAVDVDGTRHVLQACVQHGVRHLLVSSSGAAYGYHADNPDWLDESDALRGNESFAYSHHKRLVEEMLTEARRTQPQLRQTVLRIGTILGERVDNQITALFEKPRLIAIRGSDSPFVFVWDQDVIGAFLQAIRSSRTGCFNVAGDGALSIRQIAGLLGKRTREFPPALLKSLLWLGSRLGVSRYGPEQLDFLRYRPVLSNRRLKEELGYHPSKTSREALLAFIAARKQQGRPL